MKNDESLVKGGCGHSAEDVLFSAKAAALCVAAGAVIAALALLVG